MPGLFLSQSCFLHVPKTGGNWVATVLNELFPTAQRIGKIHATRKQAGRADLFTFAFVRHPLTWYQSYFSYKQRKGWEPENDWDQIVRRDSFPKFIEAAIAETPAYYSKLLRRFVGRAGEEIDFIGRFESLTEDLISALNLAGEQFDPRLVRAIPPLNQSNYQHHPAVYPEDLAQRVLEVEAEAMERFYPTKSSGSP